MPECDREASVMWKACPLKAAAPWKEKVVWSTIVQNTPVVHKISYTRSPGRLVFLHGA